MIPCRVLILINHWGRDYGISYFQAQKASPLVNKISDCASIALA